MKRLVLLTVIGVFGFASSASAEVFWKQIQGPLQVEPPEVTTSYGTSSSTLHFTELEWEGWGTNRAVGTGIGAYNSCKPFCLAFNYYYRPAKVWLTKVRGVCGQQRYMHVQIGIKDIPGKPEWLYQDYDDVSCRGSMVNPGGHPYPNLRPKPRPKSRLKLVTAKSLFNRTVKDRLPEGGKGKRYLRCYRVARLRVRCRGKWVQSAAYDLGTTTLPFKIGGFVQRNGRSYRVKIRAKYWNVYHNGLPTGGPYYFTEWGFYVVR